LRANNPEFKSRFEKYLNKKLLKEPLTEQILSSVRKNLREEFSDQSYFKADLHGPEVKLNSDESEAILTFSVANSDEYFLTFKGNTQESNGSIESALHLNEFYSSNPNIGPELASRVKAYYLSEGYSRAEVTSEDLEGSKSHQRRLVFDINEGAKVEIREIKFVGRISEAEKFYVEFIKEHSTDLIAGGYFTRSYYNRDGIELGLKNLIIDRQNHGYLKAKVVSIKTIYQGEKKNQIVITVNLDEGPLTALEKVAFSGNNSFSEEILLQQIQLRSNEPLRLNQLEESVDKIKAFYHDAGFLEMSLINERENLINYNSDATKAKVNFHIYEGPKISVGSILIEGNSITRDYVILKEIDFKVGEVLTPQKIEESIRRLQRLGHFNNVDIKTLEEKTQIEQRTVIVRVNDRNPGLFNLGVGVNNERKLTLRGYTGVAYRNLYGTGRGASIRFDGNYNIADIKYLERKVTLGYLEPYILDTRVKGRLNYTQSIYISDFVSRKATEGRQAVISLEQDLTSHVVLSFDVWNQAVLRDFPLDEGDPNQVGDVRTTIVTTGPTLDIDYRDHPFNPNTGTFTRLSTEYSTPNIGSDPGIEFIRSFASFTHYKTLGKPQSGWVWANSIRGGYLRDLSRKPGDGSDYGVPYDKKGLLLGGQSTIRGFQAGEAFPNQFDFTNEAGAPIAADKFRLKGSANMYLVKSELRFPISGALGGAGFYDGGAVYVDGQNIKDPYRDAVGMAIRYITPVGAASLEIAYKLDRNPDRSESQWPIFLSFGTF
jgi:outer membrane protein insertion porin family